MTYVPGRMRPHSHGRLYSERLRRDAFVNGCGLGLRKSRESRSERPTQRPPQAKQKRFSGDNNRLRSSCFQRPFYMSTISMDNIHKEKTCQETFGVVSTTNEPVRFVMLP